MNKTSTESEKQNNHIEITKGSTNIGPICYNVVTLSQAICVYVCDAPTLPFDVLC